MTTAITIFAALVVLATIATIALLIAQQLLTRNFHADSCGIAAEPATILTNGDASRFFLVTYNWECERADEQTYLRRLAQGLVYDAGLESPLSPPQIIPARPLFAPLPASNNVSLLAA